MRLGLHRMSGRDDALFREYVDTARPEWCKMLDEFPAELIDFCHERGTKVIGRIYFDNQDLSTINARINRVVTAARQSPGVDAWELDNEAHQSDHDAAAYAAASIRFIDAMARIGCKAAIGSFSVGQPELWYWRDYMPAIRHAASLGHYVALHEYGSDDIRQGVSDGRGWWMLRYRRAVAEWYQLGLSNFPQILVTESGKDNINPDGKGGWRNRAGDYVADMAWYCRELSRDPYIAGVVDFGWSTVDKQWSSFDIAGDPPTARRMAAAMAAIPRAGASPGISAPVPAPPVTPPSTGATDDVRACVQVRRGDGWTAIARRALGRNPKRAEVVALQTANATVTLAAGQWVVSPWHKVVQL